MNVKFKNGAELYLRSAFHSADASRGLSADLLLVDEVQDVAAGRLPVLAEVMSHARGGRMILTGTPKLIDNHLESYFNQSTANYWTMICDACSNLVTIDERALGPTSLVCPSCQQPVNPAHGAWVPRNPMATWGDGFTISHPMVPWINYPDVLERQRTYDLVSFRNEVLGLPTTLGEHVVTRAELEACCTETPMAAPPCSGGAVSRRHRLGGWNGVANGAGHRHNAPDFTFQVQYMCAFHAREEPNRIVTELARQCREFRVAAVAADGNGIGHVYNRLLFDQFQPALGFYTIFYAAADQQPTRDGVLHHWTVNRSRSIGIVFSRVKRRQLMFPLKKDMDPFLDEFACETAEYNDHTRRSNIPTPTGIATTRCMPPITPFCSQPAVIMRPGIMIEPEPKTVTSRTSPRVCSGVTGLAIAENQTDEGYGQGLPPLQIAGCALLGGISRLFEGRHFLPMGPSSTSRLALRPHLASQRYARRLKKRARSFSPTCSRERASRRRRMSDVNAPSRPHCLSSRCSLRATGTSCAAAFASTD